MQSCCSKQVPQSPERRRSNAKPLRSRALSPQPLPHSPPVTPPDPRIAPRQHTERYGARRAGSAAPAGAAPPAAPASLGAVQSASERPSEPSGAAWGPAPLGRRRPKAWTAPHAPPTVCPSTAEPAAAHRAHPAAVLRPGQPVLEQRELHAGRPVVRPLHHPRTNCLQPPPARAAAASAAAAPRRRTRPRAVGAKHICI